jgi:hypothetical protein
MDIINYKAKKSNDKFKDEVKFSTGTLEPGKPTTIETPTTTGVIKSVG